MFKYNYTKKAISCEDVVNLISHKTNYQPRLYGKGYLMRCPAHNDTNPSLSVAEGDDGRILLYCFYGCHIKDICHSIGIQVKDLFPSNNKRSSYE